VPPPPCHSPHGSHAPKLSKQNGVWEIKHPPKATNKKTRATQKRTHATKTNYPPDCPPRKKVRTLLTKTPEKTKLAKNPTPAIPTRKKTKPGGPPPPKNRENLFGRGKKKNIKTLFSICKPISGGGASCPRGTNVGAHPKQQSRGAPNLSKRGKKGEQLTPKKQRQPSSPPEKNKTFWWVGGGLGTFEGGPPTVEKSSNKKRPMDKGGGQGRPPPPWRNHPKGFVFGGENPNNTNFAQKGNKDTHRATLPQAHKLQKNCWHVVKKSGAPPHKGK